jgi:uncharacterized protein (DUF1919 family)
MSTKLFTYEVAITGLDVPLRTTRAGAKALIKAFDKGDDASEILVRAMNNGISFKNKNIAISMAAKPKKATKKKKT